MTIKTNNSTYRELIFDARRNLKAVGYTRQVHDGSAAFTSKGLVPDNKNGVLFVTYALLVSGK